MAVRRHSWHISYSVWTVSNLPSNGSKVALHACVAFPLLLLCPVTTHSISTLTGSGLTSSRSTQKEALEGLRAHPVNLEIARVGRECAKSSFWSGPKRGP